MIFFNLTKKSLKRPRWCHSAVFIGSFLSRFKNHLLLTLKTPSICLEQNSIAKREVAFLVAFSIIPTFSENGRGNQKNLMMSGKVEISRNKMLYAESSFL